MSETEQIKSVKQQAQADEQSKEVCEKQNKKETQKESQISKESQKIKNQDGQRIQTAKQQEKVSQQQQPNSSLILNQLKQLNETVISDISIKKGRTQKFFNHINKIENMKNNFAAQQQKLTKEEKQSIYQKMSIVYYNLARLGQNQDALQTAILLLEISESSKYLVIRWKMQLAAMKSSSDHNGSYMLAVEVLAKIVNILQDLTNSLSSSKPKMSSFLSLALKVIRSQKRNDFIWIHNFQNNMKCFTDHIRQLMMSSMAEESKNSEQTLLLGSNNNLKVVSFFPGYDFQIADYMSLQKLEIDYIQKYNQLSEIKQIVKEIIIFASISCFTQATENYYMNNYSFKYLHFKAIQIALLAVDKQCTYIGFLMKILNEYYGTKMSQIRQENSEIMEINQLKRRIPRDKRQVNMKNVCFAQ